MGLHGPRGCTNDPQRRGLLLLHILLTQSPSLCGGTGTSPRPPKDSGQLGAAWARDVSGELDVPPRLLWGTRGLLRGPPWLGHRQPWPIVRLWVTDPGASGHVPAPLPACGAETHLLSPVEPQGSPLSPSRPEAPARREGSPLPPVHSRLHEKPGKRDCASSQGERGSSETAGHCPESHGTTRPAENGTPPASSDHTAHPQENSSPGLPAAGAPSFPRCPCQELRLAWQRKDRPQTGSAQGPGGSAPGGTQARGHLQDRQPVQAQGSRGGLAPSAAPALSPKPGCPAMSHLLVCPQKVPEAQTQVTACTGPSTPVPRGTLVPLPGEASRRGLACGCALLPAPCVSGGASAWKQRGPAALPGASLPPPPTGAERRGQQQQSQHVGGPAACLTPGPHTGLPGPLSQGPREHRVGQKDAPRAAGSQVTTTPPLPGGHGVCGSFLLGEGPRATVSFPAGENLQSHRGGFGPRGHEGSLKQSRV